MDQPTKQVTHVRMPVELMNGALNYLATRPLGEVVELWLAIKNTADASFAEQSFALSNPPEPPQ